MKIYTKKGDRGTTGLIGGTRVPKYDLRIESYGTVDELNSYIGLLRDHNEAAFAKTELLEIQDRLFTIGSLLAADPEGVKMNLPMLSENDITFLETLMDEMDESLPEMRSFVLPGGHLLVSHCHVARCICRRAERLIAHLDAEEGSPQLVLPYMNRLSDYLFVLSRYFTLKLNAEESPWKPRV